MRKTILKSVIYIAACLIVPFVITMCIDSKLKAIKMLDYLDEYTNFHFKEEEKLQENAGYPEMCIRDRAFAHGRS